jgi:signal transduction histidine kinase
MRKKSDRMMELVGAKFAELDATIAVYETSAKGALAVVKTNVGQQVMDSLRSLISEMRQAEREAVLAETSTWERNHIVNRNIAAAGTVLNIILILLAGHLASAEIRRRTSIAQDLEKQVAERTRELSALSSHLQRVIEVEKSALARELHDELGGLLVAVKMDLSQLQRGMDLSKPEVRTRWDRIQEALNAGVDLKRRVVEQLRPTLLDNMGLVAALRWQLEESCKQANLLLNEQLPEEEPSITNDAAIAIFRVTQEALTNIAKHARATAVRASLQIDAKQLTLIIEDNGIGLPPARWSVPGSHGLASMRHRLRSLGGELKIERVEPSGTRLRVEVPMVKISTFAEHAP